MTAITAMKLYKDGSINLVFAQPVTIEAASEMFKAGGCLEDAKAIKAQYASLRG